ncbi:MAG: ABC transporter transmembrane domain-containing protein [Bacilli bacterium]
MLRHYICVRQDGLKDCGVCSLLTIIETYGGKVSKEYLRTITNTSKNGVNAFYLVEAGKKLGFAVKGVKGDFRKLTEINLPCIAHIIVNKSYKHFVVIHAINFKKEFLVVADPAVGIRTISFSEFDRLTTSCYFLFEPVKPMIKWANKDPVKGLIESLFKNNRSLFLIIIIFSILYTAFQVFRSFSLKFIVEESLMILSKSNLIFITVMLLFVLVLQVASDYIRKKSIMFINCDLGNLLFSSIFKQVLSLPYLYFKNRTTGEVIARIHDMATVQQGISELLLSVCFDTLLAIISIMVLSFLSFKLTLIGLLSILILFLFYYFTRPYLKRSLRITEESNEVVNSLVIEDLEAIETLKNLNMELGAFNRAETSFKVFNNYQFKTQSLYLFFESFSFFISEAGISIIMLVGGIGVIRGILSFGEFLAFQSLFMYLLGPMKQVIQSFYNYQHIKVAMERISELFNYPNEVLELDNKYMGYKLKGKIEINNLSYAYLNKKEVLSNCNFQIKQFDRVLIMGETGSGKSTLARLIIRYLEPLPDQIILDDKDIKDYSLIELRERICYVSQAEHLFTGSVIDNIILNRDIDYDAFLKLVALTKADFIKERSSLGYDYLIEENGFNLSGGEKQRIILARALAKDSDIYILDESLSQVDIQTEKYILSNIFSNYPDKTFLVISHRFSNQNLFTKRINLVGKKVKDANG